MPKKALQREWEHFVITDNFGPHVKPEKIALKMELSFEEEFTRKDPVDTLSRQSKIRTLAEVMRWESDFNKEAQKFMGIEEEAVRTNQKAYSMEDRND